MQLILLFENAAEDGGEQSIQFGGGFGLQLLQRVQLGCGLRIHWNNLFMSSVVDFKTPNDMPGKSID
jgi:hypothetical protein